MRSHGFSLKTDVESVILTKSMTSDGKYPFAEACQLLGTAIRDRRRALSLNQAELSNLSGAGLAFLYELEHGKPTVRLDKLLSVLAVLGLELQLHAGKRTLVVSPSTEPSG